MERFLFITFENIGYEENIYLGNNCPQRFFYLNFIDKTVSKNEVVPTFLQNRTLKIYSNTIVFRIIEIFFKTFKYKSIITERNIYNIIGFLHKVLFKKKWIVDLPDCLFKECTSYYRDQKIKWFLSYIKSILAYKLIAYADTIIVSFSRTRFLRYYKGDISKVNFFLNAIPINNKVEKNPKRRVKNKYSLVYVGMSLPEYGLDRFVDFLKRYLVENKKVNIELTIIGHKRKDSVDLKNFTLINHERLERKEVLGIISVSDVGVVPFLKGSDIYFTYPIKSIEFFVYGNKVLLANTYGMIELYKGIKSRDIYFFDSEIYDSFKNNFHQIIYDIENGKFDNNKADKFSRFDAEKKNQKIKKIYLGSYADNKLH